LAKTAEPQQDHPSVAGRLDQSRSTTWDKVRRTSSSARERTSSCLIRLILADERGLWSGPCTGASITEGQLVADRSFLRYNEFVAKTIAQRELRNDNAKVIEAVAAGESFVVTRNGVPVAELRPIQQARRTFVPTAELLSLAATGPRIDRKRFRADLDRVVDQGL
jgi:prevent-host-death family protein